MTPKDLDGNSIYNKALHMPIPTMDYVFTVTGIDIQVEGTTEENDRQIQSLTIDAYNILMASKTTEMARRQLEYLIAKDRTFRDAFILYAAKYIEMAIMKGEEDTNKSGVYQGIESLSQAVQSAIKSSPLRYNLFNIRLTDDMYRSDY